MENPPLTRIRKIMTKMLSIVGSVYSIIGLLGYSMFKSEIKGKFFAFHILLDILKG